jgi:hypothetical protein
MQREKLFVKVFYITVFIMLLGACSSSPTYYNYPVSSTSNKTVEVPYKITDQQAYAISKAWVSLWGGRILTDDSNGGVLAASGVVYARTKVENEDREIYPHSYTLRIFIANGVARLDYSATKNTEVGTNYEAAKGFADHNTSNAVNDAMNSFRRAFD